MVTVPTQKQETDDARRRLLRQSERRSRARRIDKIQRMRQRVEMLSRVQCVLPLLEDTDAVWDPFLDDELRRTRDLVRRLLPGTKAIAQVMNERALLTRLLEEHELMARALRDCVTQSCHMHVHDWESNVQRWRALARIHFRPWTIDECEHEIEKATNEMNRFLLSNDRQTTGLSFMGWQDSRRIDPNSLQFQFTLAKTFQGFDLDHYVASSWRVYTEGSVFGAVVLGGHAKLSFEVLQELSPTMCLIRSVEKYDSLPRHVHCVYLVARIDTDDGIVQFMRSVSVPEVQRAICEPTDAWACDFYWMRWEILDSSKPRSSTDFRVSLGGTVTVEDTQYLHYWLFELLDREIEHWGVINPPIDSWAADIFWMGWVVLDRAKPPSSSDFRVPLGGTMSLEDLRYLQYWLFELFGGTVVVEDPPYLHDWLFELLGAIVRSEAWSTNRQLLDF